LPEDQYSSYITLEGYNVREYVRNGGAVLETIIYDTDRVTELFKYSAPLETWAFMNRVPDFVRKLALKTLEGDHNK
jgi:hypothetical protein